LVGYSVLSNETMFVERIPRYLRSSFLSAAEFLLYVRTEFCRG